MTLKVDAFIVKPTSISEKIDVPGTLIANEATDIHPEISGRLAQLNVAEGKFVTKGALLAKTYDGDLQAQLKKLQVQLEIAKTNEERSAQLLKIQGISKADYDATALNVSNIQADIDVTKANITKTEIRAPFNGKLGLKNISPGAYVTPATILASIQEINLLKLDFTVPEKYSSQMNPGREVFFSIEGSNKTYSARIMATESSVTQDTRTLTVRSIVQNKDAALVPGSFAKVMLNFEPDPNALMIPSQAIIPQARGKKVVIYKDNVAKFVDVTTGIRDSARVQVLTGLRAGDTVVITGLMSVKPESKIEVERIAN
ncbi:MAG: efflux RND transporter periplasmic adaptor subunit [Acidobacteria bacterium]|nr:MAG: efflux RND transporter periplasmic adaptor subunit [Acidobacteriota bacterium]